MSGHRPLLFYTTPSSEKNQQIITNLVNSLSERYLLRYSFPESIREIAFDEATQDYRYKAIDKTLINFSSITQKYSWLVIDGSIILGNSQVWITIRFMPVSYDDRRVVVFIDFTGELYDSFFTKNISLKRRKVKEQKQVFLRFCVDVAKAVNIDGFVVRDPIDIPPPIDHKKLLYGFFDVTDSSEDFIGSFNGVSIKGLDVSSITQSKVGYVFRDFLILDHI